MHLLTRSGFPILYSRTASQKLDEMKRNEIVDVVFVLMVVLLIICLSYWNMSLFDFQLEAETNGSLLTNPSMFLTYVFRFTCFWLGVCGNYVCDLLVDVFVVLILEHIVLIYSVRIWCSRCLAVATKIMNMVLLN